jgi:hypothetical protein
LVRVGSTLAVAGGLSGKVFLLPISATGLGPAKAVTLPPFTITAIEPAGPKQYSNAAQGGPFVTQVSPIGQGDILAVTSDPSTSTAYIVSNGAVKSTFQIPTRVANDVAPFGDKALVAMADGNLVEVSDDATQSTIAHLDAPLAGIAVEGQKAYVTTLDAVLWSVDLQSGKVSEVARRAGDDGHQVTPLAVTADGVWWAFEETGKVRFVPTKDAATARTVDVGCLGISDILIRDDHLYSTCEQKGAFSDFDLTTNTAKIRHGGGFPISMTS